MSELLKYTISATIVVASVLGMYGLYKLKTPPKSREIVELLPTIATSTINKFDGKLQLEISGSVVPYREITLAAEVAGRVDTKCELCTAGTFVKAETPLLTIDQEDYQLEIKRLTAELQQSESMIHELDDEIEGLDRSIKLAEDDLKLQQSEYDRRNQVRGAVSISEIQDAKRALNAAQLRLTELKNALSLLDTRKSRLESGKQLSQIELDKAQVNLRRTEIIAPYNGVIVSDLVERGDYVQKGQEVVLFEDTSKAEVRFNLRLDQLAQILKYQPPVNPGENQESVIRSAYELPNIEVQIVAQSDRTGEYFQWTGQLRGYDGIGLDEVTKTIPCRAVIDQPVISTKSGPKALVRGMFVKVHIELDPSNAVTQNQLVSFPAVAVQPGNFIWLVRDNVISRHNVEIIDRQRLAVSDSGESGNLDKVVIAIATDGDFQHNEDVVVSPLAQPTPGIEVKVIRRNGKLVEEAMESPPAEPDIPAPAEGSTKVTARKGASRS